jgi:anti-sigma factor RsiW
MLQQNESELLSAYADKELTGDELLHVQERLTASIEWREELERLQKTKKMTTALPLMAAPADLLNFLEEKIQQQVESKPSRWWSFLLIPDFSNVWAMGSSMAAAAVLVISIGAYRIHEKAFIPLDPLLEAHTRVQSNSMLHQHVLTASLSSSHQNIHGQN